MRAFGIYQDQAVWQSLQQRGMATDVGWSRPARHYADLYKALARAR